MDYKFNDAMKGFDFSPWGGIEGFLKQTSNGAAGNNGVHIKRVVPELSRAVDMTATAISTLPFEITNKSGDVVDSSEDWKNKLGGMTDPKTLFYKLASSLCGGAAYAIPMQTSKAIVDIQYVVPHSITPQINIEGLQWFDRNTDQGLTEKLMPDELLYFWLPDSDIEIGPALNTPLSAAFTDALLILNSTNTMKIYGERGFVPITVLGAKNMPNEAERQKAEGFFNRLLQGGFDVLAKIINSEALSIVRLGAGYDELKGAYVEIKRESAESVGKSFGIPAGLFMSDNAFATEFKALTLQWYTTSRFRSIYHTIEGTLNEQLFKPRGYSLHFDIQALDIFQEDEASRSASLSQFVSAVQTDPAIAQFGMDIMGYDLTQEQQGMFNKIVAEKKAEKEEEKKRMQEQFEIGRQDKKEQMQTRWGDRQDKEKPKPFQRKALNPDEIKDLALWYSKAKAWHKQGKSAVDWENKSLPEEIAAPIRLKLAQAVTELDIVKAFEVGETETPAPVYESEIVMLADAINRAAAEGKKSFDMKYNPNHEPAGSSIGGQFAEDPGGGGKYNNGKPYYRYTNSESPLSDWGHAMFADSSERVEHYGKNQWLFKPKKEDSVVSFEDVKDKIKSSIQKYVEMGYYPQDVDGWFSSWIEDIDNEVLTIDELVNEFNPEDIADAALAWDNPVAVQFFYDNVAEPEGIDAIILSDGAIVFNEDLIEKGKK